MENRGQSCHETHQNLKWLSKIKGASQKSHSHGHGHGHVHVDVDMDVDVEISVNVQ
jgi:hypothetical protein